MIYLKGKTEASLIVFGSLHDLNWGNGLGLCLNMFNIKGLLFWYFVILFFLFDDPNKLYDFYKYILLSILLKKTLTVHGNASYVLRVQTWLSCSSESEMFLVGGRQTCELIKLQVSVVSAKCRSGQALGWELLHRARDSSPVRKAMLGLKFNGWKVPLEKKKI